MSISAGQFKKKIRRRLGDVRRRLRARPSRTQRQKELLLKDASLSPRERDLLGLIDSRISPHDGMYKGDGAHYFKVGLSAINCIENAMAAAGLSVPKRVMDLPCGHGRVLRFLVQRFPEADFTACDLDVDGVDFCTQVFGARGNYSSPDLSELSLEMNFDLIWCGSLLTHLDQPRIVALLKFMVRHLLPEGLLVFTAAGDRVAEWMVSGEFDYGIAKSAIPQITSQYRDSGYAYTDYPYMPDYGISLTSPEWVRDRVRETAGVREVYFAAHGWDDHQDVYGFVKESKV
jgi:SAM-dependent methyltransferase